MVTAMGTLPGAARGQAPAGIGVTATAAYAQIWNRPADRSQSPADELSARFNGRVGVAIAPAVYLGVAAGSWRYVASNGKYDPGFGELAAAVATAVVASSYVQWYPQDSRQVFLRGGLGYVSAITYYPVAGSSEPQPLIAQRHVGASASAGGGVDLPIAAHFAITASLDYTRVLGGAAGFEPVSAVLVGLGLTVR